MIQYFAYGSFLTGCRYHKYYLGDQKLLGKGEVEGYKRYIFGALHGIYPQPGERVQGEVYEIDSKALHKLEFMHGNFTLAAVDVEMEDGQILSAQTFIWNG
ncbi:MAG TPA: gamma-glutamylcyclotransferase [Syntrophomonadaceae bacterium]|nr:gamma-glutamylcyclotransferase [Syntrophomonadaceae bacterium]